MLCVVYVETVNASKSRFDLDTLINVCYDRFKDIRHVWRQVGCRLDNKVASVKRTDNAWRKCGGQRRRVDVDMRKDVAAVALENQWVFDQPFDC